MQIAEDADAGLLFDENKAAKIAVESLNPRSHGDEIVIGTDVVKLSLSEGFLQANVSFESRSAAANIHVHDSQFAHFQVVQANHRSDANPPIDRAERSVAMKKIE